MELEQYQSYFQKEITELMANPDEKEEGIIFDMKRNILLINYNSIDKEVQEIF